MPKRHRSGSGPTTAETYDSVTGHAPGKRPRVQARYAGTSSPVQRKSVVDAMDAPKEDSIYEERATIDPNYRPPTPPRRGRGGSLDIDAPKEDSIYEERATIDPNYVGHGAAAAGPRSGGGSSRRSSLEIDAPKEDSILEERATISAEPAAGILSPRRAQRAASRNGSAAGRLGFSASDFHSSNPVNSPAFAQDVAAFQQQHGLGVDGVVGRRTMAALRAGRAEGASASNGSLGDDLMRPDFG